MEQSGSADDEPKIEIALPPPEVLGEVWSLLTPATQDRLRPALERALRNELGLDEETDPGESGIE